MVFQHDELVLEGLRLLSNIIITLVELSKVFAKNNNKVCATSMGCLSSLEFDMVKNNADGSFCGNLGNVETRGFDSITYK